MGCFDARGNGICQSCGKTGPGHEVRRLGIEFLRVLGWHYGSGDTIGGQQYEALLCPACSKDEHRRKVTKPTIKQDALPLDWDACKTVPQSQGGYTR